MTASYQPTVVPNKDLGIWNEPVKIVINSCLYNVTICFVIRDAKRKNSISLVSSMRKLDFFRLPALRCASTAAGAGSLKKSNFLIFSKVLRKGADQANSTVILYALFGIK